MANKFLGLDSVNVFIDYIDKKVKYINENTRILTIQIYKLFKNTEMPDTPIGGGFDINAGINYPEGWNSLYGIFKDKESSEIEILLKDNAVWMSSGVIHGLNNEIDWSTPIQISGINGNDGTDFRFSYDKICAQKSREVLPPELIDEDGKNVIYYWIKSGDGEWPADDVEGSIWAKYTTDGKNATQVLYRYRLTSADEVNMNDDGYLIPIAPAAPSSSVDNAWVKTILNLSITKENPYLWISTAISEAGKSEDKLGWSDPVLFSAMGKDGNVPDYTVNLYCKGSNDDTNTTPIGVIAPDKPEFKEDTLITEYITDNWLTLPGEDDGIWWMCTFNVKGLNNKVIAIGDVKRYNGVDGEALPGQYTKLLYRWSNDQTKPEFSIADKDLVDNWKPKDWDEDPNENELTGPAVSLWMTIGLINGLTEDGYPNVTSWSDPVKITGPQGPLSYDYRLEMRYMNGTSSAPSKSPETTQWEEDVKNTPVTSEFPYIWAKPYLVYYKMKYKDTPNADGSYDIVQINEKPDGILKEFTEYRLSGLNGEDGSTKNKLTYNTDETSVVVDNFSMSNLYIYNGTGEMNYVIEYNQIDFISGYTGKFVNAGTGTVKITTIDPYVFVGSGKEVTEITLEPQESIELVCHKTSDKKQFIVIGKTL